MRTGQLEHNCSLDDILAHLSETSFSAIPDDAAERTALITADIAACIVGGWKDRAAGETGDFVIENGGKEESTLWGRGKKVPAAQAAFACAVSARAFEFGVVDCDAPGAEFKPLHSAETLVPVALAVAEKSGSSGRDVLAALALGEDLAARLTAALDFSLPLDCRGTVNAVCSAAVAGKLLKLDEKRLRSAFGLVLHQLNGVRQGIHYSLGQGIAAHAGTSAALLASRGLLGVENMEDELAGLVHALGAAFDPAPLFRELGKSYFSSITFKPYPCCRAAHGAVDAVLNCSGRDSLRKASNISACLYLPGRQGILSPGPSLSEPNLTPTQPTLCSMPWQEHFCADAAHRTASRTRPFPILQSGS